MNRPNLYYILDPQGNVITTDDLYIWADFFKDKKNLIVAKTQLTDDVLISTVFLAFDHGFLDDEPPILWETMIFGGTLDGYQERYTTKEMSIKGHADAVMLARNALPPKNELPDSGAPFVDIVDGVK